MCVADYSVREWIRTAIHGLTPHALRPGFGTGKPMEDTKELSYKASRGTLNPSHVIAYIRQYAPAYNVSLHAMGLEPT